ncbi:MAG TPA: D-alanyl-D-alanine carboxypeptidase [Desulfobacterales bacterium]|nr:D-alanyl-D-alanine carboxypeptidase [Desulfobacterales bacterium]HIP40298.1 D-alanyl-D-alanine carboxypeptidase [Desulfocapsa sulfexigens]
MKNIQCFIGLLLILFTWQIAWAGRAQLATVAADPYASAFVLDAETGKTLFSKNADAPVYPASTLKLMVLAVILDRIEQGTLQLNEMVQITVEAYKMGGSQVYLDPKEQFPIEELLYALMIQSANDAAVALATHVAGTKEEFVALMNQKAEELGMKNTKFYSVHGLPPSKGQHVDVTTARDFGILCRYLSTRPEVFKYTETRVRDFRGGEFVMRTHNHLLEKVEGCDGFKTGYFTKAGFSIAATAKRGGVRIIAIVMGSKDRKVRDAKAIELIAKGFAMVPAKPEKLLPATPVKLNKKVETDTIQEETAGSPALQPQPQPTTTDSSSGWNKLFIGFVLGFLSCAALNFFVLRKRSRNNWRGKRF